MKSRRQSEESESGSIQDVTEQEPSKDLRLSPILSISDDDAVIPFPGKKEKRKKKGKSSTPKKAPPEDDPTNDNDDKMDED